MNHLIKDDWYRGFFTGINCELWQKAVSADWTEAEVNFLAVHLNLQNGCRLLDIPCGYGRHSIALAKRGAIVTAVDISETFIRQLHEKVVAENLAVTPVLADMIDVKLDRVFDGAICMGNSFGYFDRALMQQFIGVVAKALKPGARFIINSAMVAESILPNFSAAKSFVVDDIQMDIANSYDVVDSCMITGITYTRNGVIEQYAFRHYVLTMAGISHMLNDAGLRVAGLYGDISGNSYKLGDQQVYIVSEKK